MNERYMMVKPDGVLDLEYFEDRKKDRASKYRLLRRTKEVKKNIQQYKGLTVEAILDIGTADGRMLDLLTTSIKINKMIGLDYSCDLIRTNNNQKNYFFQGDATCLPFKENFFDIIIATAIIEHVSDPLKMLHECYRVLKNDGICIITTPDPFYEKIATKIGHLRDDQHNITMDLLHLTKLTENEGFKVIKAEKFMMSPIGFPFEDLFESLLKRIGFDFLLLNQLVIGVKEENDGEYRSYNCDCLKD